MTFAGPSEIAGQQLAGRTAPLGYPTSNHKCGFRNGGCNSHFEGGSIYHTAATGAHDVQGPIRSRWIATNWQDGPLGYPTSDHKCGFRNGGCNSHFEGGSIYHTAATGAHDVQGPIRSRWSAGGWQDGPLGYPTSDHKCGFRNDGCNTHFEGGSIYHTPTTGAHAVSGVIRDFWASGGWQDGTFGYPTGEERAAVNGRIQRFEKFAIYLYTKDGNSRASLVTHQEADELEL